MSGTCAFCAIISGEQKAVTILETERLIAFLDHRPLFYGHTLLLPKQHMVLLSDLPADQVPVFRSCVGQRCRRLPGAAGLIVGAAPHAWHCVRPLTSVAVLQLGQRSVMTQPASLCLPFGLSCRPTALAAASRADRWEAATARGVSPRSIAAAAMRSTVASSPAS